MSGERLLVPVSDSVGLRQTVEYAVSRALADGTGTVRFVVVHSPDLTEEEYPPGAQRESPPLARAEKLLDRVSVWAKEDAGTHTDELTIETSHVGENRYLFSPGEVASALAAEANTYDIDRIVLDPEYDPGIGAPFVRPLEAELSRFDLVLEEAPISRQTRRAPLLVRSSPLQIGSLFLISFLFYMVLAADPFYWFEWVTGIVSATVVAIGLSRVTFSEDPSGNSLLRLLRHTIYVPYLLWEIIKSNVQIAAVILHPRLPIDPRLTRFEPAIWGSLPITTFANSVTLTPGTLSVRVDGNRMIIHTLVPAAREDLFEGGLERAVRFVFYGRKAMNIPSPIEREDAEILQKPPGERDEGEGVTDGPTADEPGENTTDRSPVESEESDPEDEQ